MQKLRGANQLCGQTALVRIASAAFVLLLAAALPMMAEQDDRAAAAAQGVRQLLEANRVEEAVQAAADASQRHPDAPEIALLAGQAQFRRGIDLGRRLEAIASDLETAATLASNEERLLRAFRSLPPTRRSLEQEMALADLVAAYPKMAEQMRASAVERLSRSGGGDGARMVESLGAGLAELARAIDLDGENSEAQLSILWARTAALTYSRRWSSLTDAPPEWLVALQELAKRDGDASHIIRDAASVARAHDDDPTALAGAADIIATVAAVIGRRDPLASHARALVNHSFFPDPAAVVRDLRPAVRDGFRAEFRRTMAEFPRDAAAAPWAAVRHLYRQAWEKDTDRTLARLGSRVCLLEAAFDDERRKSLLAEIEDAWPDEAFVPLERARWYLLVEGDLGTALEHFQRAAAKQRFTRSDLVAAPDLLRPSLRLLHPFVDLTSASRYRMDYDAFFKVISRLRREGNPQLVSSELRVIDLLLRADDWFDQQVAVGQKAALLQEMAEDESLSPPRRAAYAQQLRQHLQSFASFPQRRTLVEVSLEGLRPTHVPRLGAAPRAPGGAGYRFSIAADGRGAILRWVEGPRDGRPAN